ncbi:MAG: phosphoribosylaminoimidazolecarboxamide formyltransferase / cyclohydrolase [Eubacteriaceae bacterium]|nr:phosphoribosylaminoimidazolecarboxamide formyltransferase / cyclohydrolase [Eubacteriaceae bacterium]MDK2960897.1 phosphoribosylaminoimidazolecarboxamide formyltransferase / cyclohydrolase [Eubacteriaceae bacterium]
MRALISVSDKTGIVEFAKQLEAMGFEILSTGGTLKALSDAGLKVIAVSDVTGFPECLDGRVKTLHPKIHGGILGIRDNKEHQKQMMELEITPIDLLVINLYPFKNTILKEGVVFEDAIENIDIGGPTMLRSAAKNFNDVTVITDPEDYSIVLEELKSQGKTALDTRYRLALKVFETTANYDAMISDYLRKRLNGNLLGETITMTFEKVQDLRYGENPHQNAAFYGEIVPVKGSLTMAKQLQGKELSYNNINDTNGALEILKEYGDEPTIVAVKHANPCGIASDTQIFEAYRKAHDADPVSIFGGIVVSNKTIDGKTAQEMIKTFLEVIVAPSYDNDALKVFSQKNNLRVLELSDITSNEPGYEVKKVLGGLLVQERDSRLVDELKVVTKRKPTETEMDDLLFAWKAVKNTKSNAISLAKNKCLIANGPGQVNRIGALENAIRQAGQQVKGSVMASDAFFPFDDCVKAAVAAGITAIIQPGGAGRDQDSIDACDEAGITMVFTGMRHFKHS